MAESFVSGIAENLVGKIASLIRDEIALVCGLETDLEKLRELLNTVNAVLLDAEEKQAQNHELRCWLGMLKNFCYDAEDVLDELEYEGLRQTVLKQYGDTKIRVCRFFSSSNPLVFRLKMGHKVKELKTRLDEIAGLKAKFHLSELVDVRQAGHRTREMTDSSLDERNIIGRDGEKVNILKLLLCGEETLSVIPIVGLGGMGKTALAKMLYNDEGVNGHFDLKIWVCVSEIFEKKQIMVNMIQSVNRQDHSRLNPEPLQQMIHEILYSRRFLLVLDDVWSDDRGKWIEFRELLRGGAAGSRVIVTTRNVSVADVVRTGRSCNLGELSHEQCLSLFKKLAFREGEEESHPHLMKIGDDIVKKCGGVPLAVKTMGTLLYSNSDERYWKSLRDKEMWKLEQKENDILPALKLSYDQLASQLKPCFAICSIFPKDHQFFDYQLIGLWRANGLLQSSNDVRDMEDIGVQYVKELYSRSFFQDLAKTDDGMMFYMHDLVHDLALSISGSECVNVDTYIERIPYGIRHMAFFNSSGPEVLNFLQKKNSLRTIIIPSQAQFFDDDVINNDDKWIFASKYLRYLDLKGFPLQVLPGSSGGLKQLRYLRFGDNVKIHRLPDFIWKLHNLLVLEVEKLQVEEFPRDVRNLIKLRYLSLSTGKQKRLPNNGIGRLTSLENLFLNICPSLEYLFEDIHELTSLRSLRLWYCYELISLPPKLKCLNALEKIEILSCDQLNWMEEDDIPDISLSLQSLRLEDLSLVETLPQWLKNSCETLKILLVLDCENFSVPRWLQDFTSLEVIKINNCPKVDSQLDWMKNRLSSLKVLRINGISEQIQTGEEWNIWIPAPGSPGPS